MSTSTPSMTSYHDGRLVVWGGDCLTLMAAMAPDSVDAIVTDPPYGLGFMGKKWDDLPPGKEWAEACYRVLKPGGHLLAFGGTRTWHRLAVAIEDGGFEIRDSLAWLYGCHDDQTEVLTRRGWVNGLDLTEDDDVAQWGTDGSVELVRPSARQRYPFDGRMVRFRNADVDQLVTPNHRVYRQVAERSQTDGKRTSTWSDWQVDEAGSINRWQPTRLPAAGEHSGPGIGGTDYATLLGWVWADGGFDLTGTGVRIYQSSVNADYVDEINALLDRLGAHKRYDYEREWKGRAYTATTWYISGDLANHVRADLPGKVPSWDLLWRMTADEKRALWDGAMKGDGSKGSRTLWQKDRTTLEWAQALLAGISCRGKVSADPRGSLYWTDRSTVELQARHLADDGEDYTGEVWCVTVPSGAFVVRRNGLVSVSGNSGFPKSMNVAKAIASGTGRPEDIRRLSMGDDYVPSGRGRKNYDHGGASAMNGSTDDVDVPDHAAEWEGWGTALKPAFEPIVVGRKPLGEKTVAANVLAHGTGALNIDGCRIETTDKLSGGHGSAGQQMTDGWERPWMSDPDAVAANAARAREAQAKAEEMGRWPANVILDESQAAALDEQTGVLTSGANPKRRGSDGNRQAYGDFKGQAECTPARGVDVGGASRFFYCAKASKAERPVLTLEDGTKLAHPTVKPVAVMRWLVRLVTPPGGLVLDTFAGTGTTGEACVLEGFRCLLAEDPTKGEQDYLPLIDQRITRAIEKATAALPKTEPMEQETVA